MGSLTYYDEKTRLKHVYEVYACGESEIYIMLHPIDEDVKLVLDWNGEKTRIILTSKRADKCRLKNDSDKFTDVYVCGYRIHPDDTFYKIADILEVGDESKKAKFVQLLKEAVCSVNPFTMFWK